MGSLSADAIADQGFRVAENSPLSGEPFFFPANTILPLSATGGFSLEWEADTDNDNTVEITGFSADFAGTFPAAYSLDAVGGGPGGIFNGQLTNVVESGGELISADFSVNTTFSVSFDGTGAVLYSRDAANFSGTLTLVNGVPVGVLTSEDPPGGLPIYLDTGMGIEDPLAGFSFGRTVTAVPEPSSLLLFGSVLTGSLVVSRRRRSVMARLRR